MWQVLEGGRQWGRHQWRLSENTQKRFAMGQRWRRSVGGRPWPGNQTTGRHFSQHVSNACGARRPLAQCLRVLACRVFASKHARACAAPALRATPPHALDKPHSTPTATASPSKCKAPTCCCPLASACRPLHVAFLDLLLQQFVGLCFVLVTAHEFRASPAFCREGNARDPLPSPHSAGRRLETLLLGGLGL